MLILRLLLAAQFLVAAGWLTLATSQQHYCLLQKVSCNKAAWMRTAAWAVTAP
jgi:hypothetical protein